MIQQSNGIVWINNNHLINEGKRKVRNRKRKTLPPRRCNEPISANLSIYLSIYRGCFPLFITVIDSFQEGVQDQRVQGSRRLNTPAHFFLNNSDWSVVQDVSGRKDLWLI